MAPAKLRLAELVKKFEQELLNEWLQEQLSGLSRQKLLMKDEELRQQCREFLSLFTQALHSERSADTGSAPWNAVRDLLANISRSRSLQGFTPRETAIFVFSLKKPLFGLLRREIKNVEALADETWLTTELLDNLGLHTTECYQKTREEVIALMDERPLVAA